MEPGFFHLGWREAAAVLMAVVIIVDWAVVRYVKQAARQARRDVTGA